MGHTFPVARSNEITKGYYNLIVGMMNRGTTNLVVRASNYRGYTTYHLTTTL